MGRARGIRRGGLIRRIDAHEIRDIKSFRRAMAAVAKARPDRVVFVVLRGVRSRFQYVEPEWSPATDGPAKAPRTKE